MATVLEYKCPCCGGKIEFDSGLQQMKCPYCDTTFDVSTLKDFDDVLQQEAQSSDEMHWETQAGSQWAQDEANRMGVYTCNPCGGELVADANTAATRCP